MHTVKVAEVLHHGICVSSEDGQRIHKVISPLLRKDINVQLDFQDVTAITSAFLNAAVGQLYSEPERAEAIDSLLTVTNMEADDKELLDRVRESAILFFADPKRFSDAANDVFGNYWNG